MATSSGGVGPPHYDPNDRTLPAWMDEDGDHGVVIILQMRTTTDGKPLPKNPFTVAKTVQQNAGKIASAYNENRGMSMVLKVRNVKQAQQLKKINKLVDGTEVVVTDHPTLNQTRCVVSCSQSIGMSEAELIEELKEQGVIGVRKFTKMINGVKTETASMVLTIQGSVKPEYIYFGFQRCDARLYIPSPMLCYKCFDYGHGKMKCEKNPVCRHCSTSHEQQLDAEGRQVCSKPAFCKNCNGNHAPAAKNCPRFIEETEIARIRVEHKISFAEARQKVVSKRSTPSFAKTVSHNFHPIEPHTRVQESEVVQSLRRELAETKKALGEVNEARAAIRELAEVKKELTEARKAAKEVEMLRREIGELKSNQFSSTPTPMISDENDDENEKTKKQLLTKNQRKALKKQEKETKNKQPHSPEAKKPKQYHTPQNDQVNKTELYYKLDKENLLDEKLRPLDQRKSRTTTTNQRSNRSVSRSPLSDY